MGKKELGEVFKSKRKDLLVTQGQLAEHTELSINTIYQIERGQANPTIETLLTLAETLGLELHLRTKQTQE